MVESEVDAFPYHFNAGQGPHSLKHQLLCYCKKKPPRSHRLCQAVDAGAQSHCSMLDSASFCNDNRRPPEKQTVVVDYLIKCTRQHEMRRSMHAGISHLTSFSSQTSPGFLIAQLGWRSLMVRPDLPDLDILLTFRPPSMRL